MRTVLLLLLSCLVPAATAAPAPGDPLLDATLWMQTAAERQALCRQVFALATERLDQALADPAWSALGQGPEAARLPPAVIVDVDETVLDNHWYEARLVLDGVTYGSTSWAAWCAEQAATAVPGARAFCQAAHERGVTVLYVTNRKDTEAADTAANLAALGFPVADGSVRTRGDDRDKTARREQAAREHRVLLLLGDAGGDFDGALDGGTAEARREAADDLADHWGRDWLVLPNPMYGDWLNAHHDHDFGLDRSLILNRQAAALRRGPGQAPDGRPLRPAPAPGPERHPLLAAGPMAAWAEMTSAAVWVQTTRPATVQLRHWPAGDVSGARLSPVVSTAAAGDHIAVFVLDDLAPGTRQDYELYLDGERVALPWDLSVRTRDLWQWRGAPHAPPEFSLLIGSCNYVNEGPLDRPGPPYGGGHGIFEAMADEPAAAMVWLGDNTYLREVDWLTEEGMRHRYAHTRALPELQRLLGSMHHLALWDDHDYGPDNSDRSFRLAGAAREVFADYWPDPVLADRPGPGIQRRLEWGDAELFLLDDRSFRAPEGGDGMLGQDQLAWLVDALVSSRATFKLILNGGQLLNPDTRGESWNRFPTERRAFLDALREHDVRGVVLISGDRHQSELMRLPREGTYDLVEFSCSPLTAGVASAEYKSTNPLREEATWVGQRNYGRLTFSGEHGDRSLTLTCLDAAGRELWSRRLHQTELGHPRR